MPSGQAAHRYPEETRPGVLADWLLPANHRRDFSGVMLGLFVALSVQASPAVQRVEENRNPASVTHLMEWGQRHEHGVGADQDMDRAIRLYCKAAELGEAEALYRLGWIYSTGRAGKVDEVLGAAWFKAAVAAKYPRAMQQVARLGANAIELDQAPECLLSDELVARRIPKSHPVAKAQNAESPSFVVRDIDRTAIRGLVRRLAPEYRLDPELVLAVIEVESNFNPQAKSPKSAQGLMQLIPETAERFGVKNVWDPVDNLRGGMSYLRWLLDHFEGDTELALAGYNAGENAVHKYRGIPPYPETQGYVKRITKKLNSGGEAPRGPRRNIQTGQPETSSIGNEEGPVFKTVGVADGSS